MFVRKPRIFIKQIKGSDRQCKVVELSMQYCGQYNDKNEIIDSNID